MVRFDLPKRKTLKPWVFTHVATALVLLSVNLTFATSNASAQGIDFGRISAFESMGTGVARGASSPKTIVDDNQRHTVFLTIWDSDADAKVSWKSLDSDAPRTAVIHGTGVRAFQTNGEFTIQAVGTDHQRVKYDYVLVRLREQ